MKKLFIILMSCLLAVGMIPSALATGENVVTNGDFEMTGANDLPLGWSFDCYNPNVGSYAKLEDDSERGKVVMLSSTENNDFRLIQRVGVQPNTIYRFSCDVKTENVIGGGANISVLESFASSKTHNRIIGETEWTTIEMYGKTGENQESVTVAVRIGGYSDEGAGTAWFDNVSVAVADSAPDGQLQDLFRESSGTTDNKDNSEKMQHSGMIILMTAAFIAVFAFVYLKFIRTNSSLNDKRPVDKTTKALSIAVAIAVAFVVRILCNLLFTAEGGNSVMYGHPTDINCFTSWGGTFLDSGTSRFYTSTWADYPPGYMYILGLCAGICRLLHISISASNPWATLIFKLPSIAADLVLGYLVYRIASKKGQSHKCSMLFMCMVLFNPLFVFISSVWGQIDTILSLFIVIAIMLFVKGENRWTGNNKYILVDDKKVSVSNADNNNNKKKGIINPYIVLAGLVYGIAIAVKPQALMAGPVFAVAYVVYCVKSLTKKGDSHDELPTALVSSIAAVLAAVAFIIITALPFAGADVNVFELLKEKYMGTATSYEYASIEAFNFMALIGGLGETWIPVDRSVIGGITYMQLGTAFMVTIGVLCAALYVYSKFAKNKHTKHSLILCTALMLAGLFTFGHYMHERYIIPVTVLIAFAAVMIQDRRLWVSYGMFSVSALLNAMAAFVIVGSTAEIRSGIYTTMVKIGSLITIAAFCYFAYVCISLIIKGNRQEMYIKSNTVAKKPQQLNENSVKATYKLPGKTDRRLHFKLIDYIAIFVLTVVYGIIALTNLGTTQAPETTWERSVSANPEYAVIDLGGEHEVGSIYVFGGIKDGEITIYDKDGKYITSYTQENGNMFRWHQIKDVKPFTTDSIQIWVSLGSVDLKEICVKDTDGNVLKLTGNAEAALLVDEQDQIPETFSYMNGMYFDELYHGRTAYEHLNGLDSYENSHPPLGKIFISIGVAIFGMNAFGWRFIGAVFGIMMVPIMYCFSKRLLKKSGFAILATTLFTFDFMHYVQTRIATIDTYGVFFILLMFFFMYEYFRMNFFADGVKRTLLPLGLAGLFFGLGAASKWICFYAGGGLAVMLLISFIQRYIEYRKVMREGSDEDKAVVSKYWGNVIVTCLWCCLFFVAIPVLIYCASYLVYPDVIQAFKTSGIKGYIGRVWHYQDFMFGYHSGLDSTHPYQSTWIEWMTNARPMWYYKASELPSGMSGTISAFGNPMVWWVCLLGTVVLAFRGIWKKVKHSEITQNTICAVIAIVISVIIIAISGKITKDTIYIAIPIGSVLATLITCFIYRDKAKLVEKLIIGIALSIPAAMLTNAFTGNVFEGSSIMDWMVAKNIFGAAKNTELACTIPSCIMAYAIVYVLKLVFMSKPSNATTVLIIGILANLGPWMFVTRCTFIYHYFATVPFIIIAAVYLLMRLEEKYSWLSYAKWLWGALAVAMFALFYPVLTGIPVADKYIEALQWLPRWTFMGYTGPSTGRQIGLIVAAVVVAMFVIGGIIARAKKPSDTGSITISKDEN